MATSGGALLMMVISAQASRGSSAPLNPYLNAILIVVMFFAAIAIFGGIANLNRSQKKRG